MQGTRCGGFCDATRFQELLETRDSCRILVWCALQPIPGVAKETWASFLTVDDIHPLLQYDGKIHAAQHVTWKSLTCPFHKWQQTLNPKP